MRRLALFFALFTALAGALSAGPPAPLSITATATGRSKEVALQWSAVTAVAGALSGYHIYYNISPSVMGASELFVTGTAAVLTGTPLADRVKAWFYVAAEDSGGGLGTTGTAATAAPFQAPEAVTLTAQTVPFGPKLYLSWNVPAAYGTVIGAYKVEALTGSTLSTLLAVPASTQGVTVTAACGQGVSLSVRAYDAFGTSGAASAPAYLNVPCAPVLSAGPVSASAGTVGLIWGAVAGAASYEIRRASAPAMADPLPNPEGVTTTTAWSASIPGPGQAQYYRVYAMNAQGLSSSASNEVSLLEPPADLKAGGNLDKVVLRWSAPPLASSLGITAYVVYYASHTVSGYSDPLPRLEAQAPLALGTAQGLTLTGFGGSALTWYFQVAALSGGFVGPASANANAVPVLPNASFNSAVSLSGGALSLAWTPVDPGNGMAVYYSVSRAADAALSAPVFLTQTTSLSVVTQNAGTVGYYYVGASLSNGAQSLLSPPASVVLRLPNLAAPVVAVPETSNARVKLTWAAVANATSYLVYRSTAAGVFSLQANGTVAGPEYVDTAPVNNGNNVYQVYARMASPLGGDLISLPSASVTATPKVLPGIPGRYGSSSGGSDLAYLTAVARTLGGVDLRWTPSGAGSSAVSGYRVWRGWSAQSLTQVATLFGATNTAYADPSAPDPRLGLVYGVDAFDMGATAGPRVIGSVKAPSALPPAQNLKATVFTSSGDVLLSWAAPSGQGSYPLSGYVLTRRWQSGAPYDLLGQVTTTAYRDLSPAASQGSQPSYQVQAQDSAGGLSAGITLTVRLSPVSLAPALPSAVSGVAVAAQALAGVPVTLSWRPNPEAELVSAYLVYRGGSLLTQTAALTYSDSPGVGSLADYAVQAMNAQGVGVSGTVGTYFVAPPQPLVVSATTSVDPNREGLTLSVRISWTDLSAPAQVDAYDIYGGAAPFTGALGTLLAQTTTAAYEDITITPGAQVYYAVLPRSGGVVAATRTALTLTLPNAPGAISGLTGTPTSTGAVLNWNADPAATEYWVFRSNVPLDAQPLALTRIARAGGTSYTDASGGGTALIYYAVAAVNGLGRGPASQVWLTPSAGTPSSLTLAAGYGASPQVSLSWGVPASAAPATAYEVWRGLDAATAAGGGATFVTFTTQTAYVDAAGLTTNADLWYAVNGHFNGSGPRKLAGPVRVYAPPSAPIGPLASGANGAVDLSWAPASAAQGVTGWALSLSIDGVPSAVQIAGGSSYRVGSLQAGSLVDFSVRALNSAGGSPYSVSASARANSVGAAQMPISFTALSGFSGGLTFQAKVELSWSAPGAGTVLIYRSTSGPLDLNLAHGGPASSIYLTGVPATFSLLTDTVQALGQSYEYAISALSSDGLPLGESVPRRAEPVTIRRAASLPGLSGTAGDGRNDLVWGQPSDSGSVALAALPFRLHRQSGGASNPSLASIVEDSGWPKDLSGSSYTDLGLLNGISYWYLLSVHDQNGDGTRGAAYVRDKTGAQSSLIPMGPQQPPSPIIAVPGDGTVALRWVANQGVALSGAKYNVYRRPLGGDYGSAIPQLTLVGPSATEFTSVTTGATVVTLRDPAGLSTSPKNLTTYAYSISAVNSYGEGPKSPEIFVTPFRPLDPGSGGTAGRALGLSVVGKKDISLSWGATPDAPANQGYNLALFRVYRSQDGGSSYSLITSIPSSSTVTATVYVDSTTSYGTAYTYRVVPVDTMGNEGYSYNLQTVVIPPAVNSLLLFRNGFNPAIGEKLPVQYAIQQPGHVWVKVFTLNGEHVATLFNEDVAVASPDQPFLSDRKLWDGTNTDGNLVASGVYLIHFEGPGFRQNARVAVIK